MKNTILLIGSLMIASNAATVTTNAILAGPFVPAPGAASSFSYGETDLAFTDTNTGGTGTFDYLITVTYYDELGIETAYDNWTLVNGRLDSPDEGYFDFALTISGVTNDFTGLAASVSNVQIDTFNNGFSGGSRDLIQVIAGGVAGTPESGLAFPGDPGNNDIAVEASNFLIREDPNAVDAESGNNAFSNSQAIDALVFSGDFFAAVPEPTSAALLGLGGLALVARRRR